VFSEVQVKTHSMNKEEFENIVKELGDLKNLPNSKLIEIMDKLSTDFDLTKNNIIGLTLYLDKVEELYNKSLEEFQSRK
jgi:predicted ATP-grasp superfamily ATP-dependent carboligase